MFKKDLSLNNLQWLICHKTKPKHTRQILLVERQCITWTGPRKFDIKIPKKWNW